MNRREFLKHSAALGLAAGAAPAVLAQDRGKRYKTAIIGTGWWGTNILNEAIASGQCKIVGLCDVDQNQLDKCASNIAGKTGDQPRKYTDFREMLAWERPEICIVATPDHWHPLAMIEAVKQGAHVYVEKPVSHTVLEGRAMVAAARAADRVVQVGTHRRASPHCIWGRDFIRSGKLGKVGMVRCFVFYGGGPEKPTPNQPVPKGLDWDFWCGPAPMRPFNPRIHPKGFRVFLDYANGQLGDWGIHWLDQVRWIMGLKYPKKIFSAGGRTIKGPVVNDGNEQTTDAPDHQAVTYQFDAGFTVTWEHRYFAANNAEKTDPNQPVGCYFYGVEGTLHQGWIDGSTFYPTDPNKPPVHQDPVLHLPDQQNIRELFADFLDAIQNHRRPIADIEEGHLSTNMALLGMLSLKLGRSIEWDGDKYVCVGDPEATRMLSRKYRSPWVYPQG
ncbi:MAG TPA: Gfo/Idh/MocA family oxidoreductase [Tepidisphaeraceae bacterium]|nr:Gfo/Idh/MocA family oxidoreductase [Tepidisphaeraceae bacterium]